MRLINKPKEIDFEEKVEIEISLKELAIIYGSLATVDSNEVSEWIRKYDGIKSLNYQVKKDDLTYKIYDEVGLILKEKGIVL